MSWSIGYDKRWKRDIGYGVPCVCDHPDCNEQIDRGLGYVCANGEPYGGDWGCGLYFCAKHLRVGMCERCEAEHAPFKPKPDTAEWINFKLTDSSWEQWRKENPEWVSKHQISTEQSRKEKCENDKTQMRTAGS